MFWMTSLQSDLRPREKLVLRLRELELLGGILDAFGGLLYRRARDLDEASSFGGAGFQIFGASLPSPLNFLIF
jgi:hypothetical protein